MTPFACENPDALLLLLAADELSPAERQALNQRVAADPALAEQLRAFAEAEAFLQSGMSALDAATPLPLSAGAALRQFRQAVETDRQRRIVLRPEPAAGRRLHMQWWMYPAAAAALVLVTLMTWWGWYSQDVPPNIPAAVAQVQSNPAPTLVPPPGDVPPAVPPAMALVTPPMTSSIASPMTSSGSAVPNGPEAVETDDLAGESGIADAEQQASTLQRRSEPSTITASIFLDDPESPVD